MSVPHAIGNQTVCPYCRSGFEPEDVIHHCPACGTPHHADCFAENGGCTIFGCTAAPADEAPISITPTDFTPVPLPISNSIYNFGGSPTSAAPPPPAAIAPPPIPTGSSAPPPPLVYHPYAAQTPNPYNAYAYASYVRPKSRVVFVLLAVFFGALGAHNFYAGYNKKAVIQLCLSVCTCFYASLISWIWAIVEACTVTVDDDGVQLT